MIKVMWFLKRADHLSLEEFREWWTEHHAPDVRADQSPQLQRYVVNVRENRDELPGKPPHADDSEPEWDGVAEQWFASEAEFAEIYASDDRRVRVDAAAHTSRFMRLIVREWSI